MTESHKHRRAPLIRRDRPWNLPERAATPETVYLNRRSWLKGAGLLGVAATTSGFIFGGGEEKAAPTPDPSADLYPVERNGAYTVERAITDEETATTYNNFYEFGSHKSIHKAAQALEVRPWTVTIDGLVEQKLELDIDDLLSRMELEERVYRHRCVEAWAMTVPWSGFAMADLVALAKPTSSARYVRMETFMDPETARGQRQSWYPWPYVEGLTLEEARNELAFIATGLYGKPIPRQNGAPLRLVVPWKYGFKSIKSITRLTFTDQRPISFWEAVQGSEYGFWANVNPEVPHPRWSQATERLIGSDERVPTRLFNGYGEWVAGLYAGMEDEKLWM